MAIDFIVFFKRYFTVHFSQGWDNKRLSLSGKQGTLFRKTKPSPNLYEDTTGTGESNNKSIIRRNVGQKGQLECCKLILFLYTITLS